jgi:hypothetical protein
MFISQNAMKEGTIVPSHRSCYWPTLLTQNETAMEGQMTTEVFGGVHFLCLTHHKGTVHWLAGPRPYLKGLKDFPCRARLYLYPWLPRVPKHTSGLWWSMLIRTHWYPAPLDPWRHLDRTHNPSISKLHTQVRSLVYHCMYRSCWKLTTNLNLFSRKHVHQSSPEGILQQSNETLFIPIPLLHTPLLSSQEGHRKEEQFKGGSHT